MAKIRNDCFDATDELMPLDDALARLEDTLSPAVGEETVSLNDALGRVLAEDLIATRSVPPHDNSAVDGYAVFFDDLRSDGDTRLPVTGRIAAGHPLDRLTRAGEALRIFTGAPVPDGPDTIIMQEDVKRDGDDVIIGTGAKVGSNLRNAGEDVEKGDVILHRGRRMRPQDLGLAASVGSHRLPVYKRLKVAVFSTGDEIFDPGSDIKEGGIFDANRYTVMGLLRGQGCEVTDLGILPDDLDAIRDALDDAAQTHHMMVTSGGVSLGDEDHVKAAVESQGSLHFWRLAIKPGRPIALGQVGDTPFVGLPGNPVAAMVTFMRIGRLVAARLSGRTDWAPQSFKVSAAFNMIKKPGRREWLRARIENTDTGPIVHKFASDGSGILRSMVQSSGLIELPEDLTGVNEGDLVDYLPFTEVLS